MTVTFSFTSVSLDLGVSNDEQWAFLEKLLTPHPLSTYSTPLKLNRTPGEGFPFSHIVCINPSYAPLAWSRDRVESYGWPVIPIETGHDAMISAPKLLSDVLMEITKDPIPHPNTPDCHNALRSNQ